MNNNHMWVHKYQPTSLSECIIEGLPIDAQKQLTNIFAHRERPNLLLCGDPGTGKSTVARLLIGENQYSMIKLNGFDLTKERVLDLPRSLSTCTLFGDVRIVWVEEADGITNPAQDALRSIIDPNFNASWLFTCNETKKLSDAIISRFMRIDFVLPTNSQRPAYEAAIARRCRQILDREEIDTVSDAEISKVVSENYGDIRATINELQKRFSSFAKVN